MLELGAGPGVAGLIAARVARKCYLTDYHNEVPQHEGGKPSTTLRYLSIDGDPRLFTEPHQSQTLKHTQKKLSILSSKAPHMKHTGEA